MSSSVRLAVAGAAFIAMLAGPAAAEDSAPSPRKKADPDQMVCEKQEVLGSRLAFRRVCMTRSQWAEKKKDDRDLVHRTQTQLCVAMNGRCTGPQ